MAAAFDKEINLAGLNCPLPVLRAKKALGEISSGEVLKIFADDPGAREDIPAFVRQSGHRLEAMCDDGGGCAFFIRKK